MVFQKNPKYFPHCGFFTTFYNFQFDTVRPRLVRFHLVRQISGTKVRTKRVLTVVQSTVVEEQQSFDSRGGVNLFPFPVCRQFVPS